MNATTDDSTPLEKFAVAMTAFGFACITFVAAAIIIVPVTGSTMNRIAAPEAITNAAILFELFGLPVIASLFGVTFAARPIVQRQMARANAAGTPR